MPIQTLGHLEFCVNEPQTFEVEEKMAATMMRVMAVTLIIVAAIFSSTSKVSGSFTVNKRYIKACIGMDHLRKTVKS